MLNKLIEETEQAVAAFKAATGERKQEMLEEIAGPVLKLLEYDLGMFKEARVVAASNPGMEVDAVVLSATERAGDYNIIRAINGVQDA